MQHASPYRTLAIICGVQFVIMYLLVFVPVNALADAKLFNLRSFYKAVIMVAPMLALMPFFMSSMYTNRKANLALYATSALLFVLAFLAIRDQTFVGNEQFLKSMIPHHSSAITMCEEAAYTDPQIKTLCDEIIRSQRQEIDEMNRILERLR